MDSTDLAPVIRLHAQTFITHDQAPPCDGSLVCSCPDCHADRAEAVARGVRPRKPQPWDIKRAA